MACYDVVDDLQYKLRIFKLSTRTLTQIYTLTHYTTTGPEYRVLFLGNRNISGGKKKTSPDIWRDSSTPPPPRYRPTKRPQTDCPFKWPKIVRAHI